MPAALRSWIARSARRLPKPDKLARYGIVKPIEEPLACGMATRSVTRSVKCMMQQSKSIHASRRSLRCCLVEPLAAFSSGSVPGLL